MIPIGYMAKRIQVRPEWLKAPQVVDVYSVSDCVSTNFADYVPFWKHNGFWFLDSPEAIREIAQKSAIDLHDAKLLYYEAHDNEYDGEGWRPFLPESAFETHVVVPHDPKLEGFDVVTFPNGTSAGCSPLSCNSLAVELPTNAHCLLRTLEVGVALLENNAFNNYEPGPYRICSVSSLNWP